MCPWQECEDNGEDFDRVKLMEIGAEQAERWDRMKKKKNPDPGFSGQSLHLHNVLRESLVYFYLYTIFDQRRVDIIDPVEFGVHDRLHIYQLCVIFYFPWHGLQIEGTSGFVFLPKDTDKVG